MLSDKAKPSMIISHELSLDEAPDAYAHFDKRDKGWTKVCFIRTQRRRRDLLLKPQVCDNG